MIKEVIVNGRKYVLAQDVEYLYNGKVTPISGDNCDEWLLICEITGKARFNDRPSDGICIHNIHKKTLEGCKRVSLCGSRLRLTY